MTIPEHINGIPVIEGDFLTYALQNYVFNTTIWVTGVAIYFAGVLASAAGTYTGKQNCTNDVGKVVEFTIESGGGKVKCPPAFFVHAVLPLARQD